MIVIAKRNVKLFFRDRTAVAMSFLSVFIILGLYVLFLGNTLTASLPDAPGVDFLMNSWVMAGILAVTTVTSTLGAFGVMVEDRAGKIMKDFTAAPIKRSDIVGGYMLSAIAVGIAISLTTLLAAEIYIVANGGKWLAAGALIRLLGLLILSVLASSSIVFLITSLLRTQTAFTTGSTVIGTLIGFLTGIYIPIGSLPEAVQFIIKIFPVSHAGALMRSVMLERPMADSFAGAPESTVEQFKLDMGAAYQFGGEMLPASVSVLILLATTAAFYLASIAIMARKNK